MIVLEIMPLFRYLAVDEDRVTKGKNLGRKELGQNLENAYLFCSYFKEHAEKTN